LVKTCCVPAMGAVGRQSILDLQYQAPADCPSASEIKDATLRLVGEALSSQVSATVQITRDSRGYLARVQTQAGARQRLLLDSSCFALAEAIEVLLALAIDPEARVQLPNAEFTSEAPAYDAMHEPTTSQPDTSNAHSTGQATPWIETTLRGKPNGDSAHPPIASAAVLLGLESGALPRLSEVASARLGVFLNSNWSTVVTGHYWRPSSIDLATLPGAGGEFSLSAISASACMLLTGANPSLNVCAGSEAGRLTGESHGVRQHGTGASLWIAPLLGISLKLHINSFFGLVAETEGAVPIIRHGFYLQDVGTSPHSFLYQPSALSLRVNFGPQIQF
jgi:hypothetical protein